MPDQNTIQLTHQQAEEEMACYRKVYDVVRLLTKETLEKEPCSPPWKDEHPCTRCISREALIDKSQKNKLEATNGRVYYATSRYVEVDGVPSVIEMVQAVNGCLNRELVTDRRIYTDPLTGAYNRRYYEDNLRHKFLTAGIAMIDLDDFKLCNDTYGHQAGDKVLETVAAVIQKNIRGTDFLVRYGGDELLLALPDIPRDQFIRKLAIINKNLNMTIVPGYERIRLSASIGGVLSAGVTVEEAVRQADRRMYQAKRRKNAVVTDDTGLFDQISAEPTKPMVLVVDDAAMNREILRAILIKNFQIVEASSGAECMRQLELHGSEIALVLLDIVMPDMDGFEVLAWMNSHGLLEEIPVIVISGEDSNTMAYRAYELGAVDYISRPFDARVVQRRVSNTIRLFAKQRKLSTMVAQQFYEREKNDQIMIGILSQVTATHNGEDGEHVQRVQILTGILLERLVQITDRYAISSEERTLITTASALHDIGKIAVSSSLLRKTGPLTAEEKQRLHQHPMLGVAVLNRLREYQDEPLVKIAREICRWHHERYNGTGYPDRLEGEQIPISAQVVGLANVYDCLLTGGRGKNPLSYEEAVEVLVNDASGAFNPLLLRCLSDVRVRIRDELEAFHPTPKKPDALQPPAEAADPQ